MEPLFSRALHAVPIGLTWLAVSFCVQAALPPPAPDGGYPGENTAEGMEALKNLNYVPTSGDAQRNTAVGFSALFANSTGGSNTAVGAEALTANHTGDANTAVGDGALRGNPGSSTFSINNNTAVGGGALSSNATDDNTAVGYLALGQNYIGGPNTATGSQALYTNSTGGHNTANGYGALHNADASNNTGTGSEALYFNTTGGSNTATGAFALIFNDNGSRNTASGTQALQSNKSGNNNTADGQGALISNTIGSNNTALGFLAGQNLTTGSNNIDIGAGVVGAAGESGKIRIGKQGIQNSTFIAGIYNVAVAGSQVVVSSNGKLGVATSSARYKADIKPMDQASEAILALQPVTFRYKEEVDPDGVSQFGLLAEQVEKVSPELVSRDESGKAMTVRYEAVNAMLLNEFLKEHLRAEAQRKQFEAKFTQQQKQIEALAQTLQKLSSQVELTKAEGKVTVKNQ